MVGLSDGGSYERPLPHFHCSRTLRCDTIFRARQFLRDALKQRVISQGSDLAVVYYYFARSAKGRPWRGEFLEEYSLAVGADYIETKGAFTWLQDDFDFGHVRYSSLES